MSRNTYVESRSTGGRRELIPDRSSRIAREKKTVEAMIRICCRRHHLSGRALCDDCGELLAYARERLDRCPFQEGKTTCAKCPIHCYQPAMRERIRAVMRVAGPRMLWHHPVLALLHLIDGRRGEPWRPGGANSQ
ncbi:MAG: nitrous oxide-stimulated promoter family protein [Anaerolineae bacterium]|jgi:hypothetical protein